MPELSPILLAGHELTQAERLLVEAAVAGRVLDLRQSSKPIDPCIRAQVITQLLVSPLSLAKESPVAVRLRGADIRGRLNLGGRVLGCPLELHDCVAGKPIALTKAIAPNISLRGSQLRGLHANFLLVAGTLNLGGGFSCDGQTKLFGASLGELEAEGGTFNNQRGFAINADYLHVHGFATFEKSLLLGTLRMLGSQIDGQLDCSAIKITAPRGESAVELDSAIIPGGVVFHDAVIHGTVWLVGMKAEGEVAFHSAVVECAGGCAIDASSTRMRSLNFSNVLIRGEVKVAGAEITSLDCVDAQFLGPADTSLDLDSTTISGAFHAQFAKIEGRLDMTNTSMAVYRDRQSSWPPAARLIGARYSKIEGDEEAFDGDQGNIGARLQWLKLDDRYHPQKYSALATAYQNVGQEAFGRRILIASESDRRLSGKGYLLWLPAWLWSSLLRLLVGYGYAPARAVWWLLGLVVFGAVASWWAHSTGEIRLLPNTRQDFSPLRYAVDLLFPVARLPDADAFSTTGLANWLAFFLSIAGWFLAAIVVAALSGLLRRK